MPVDFLTSLFLTLVAWTITCRSLSAATRSRLATPEAKFAWKQQTASRNPLKRIVAPHFFIVEPKMTHVYAQGLLALDLALSCFGMVFLGRPYIVPTLAQTTPLNREILSISCSFFSYTNLTFTVGRYGCLCVASFKADDENRNLPNLMPFRSRLFIWRTHVWRRQTTNRMLHFGFPVHPLWIYAFGVFEHAIRGFRRSAFLFQLFVSLFKQKWHQERALKWHKNVTSVDHSDTYCLIADWVWLHVSRYNPFFKTARLLSMLTNLHV